MRRLAIFILLALAALALPAPATAGSRQFTIMQDDGLVYRDPGARSATLDEFAALGTDIVKAQVYWNEVAPRGRRKPAGFDASDPGAAGYDFGAYDAIVRGASERGMAVFFAIGNRAPDYATRKRTRRHNGTYRPSARELRLFAEAVGRRYSGSYGGLPRVSIWSIWNEPNLSSWLAPQRSRRRVPLSPSIYRNLYLAGYRGLQASGHGGDTILLGELMPLGARSRSKVPPLEFLREMACLNRRYRPYRGRAARARRCRRVKRIPTSGIAYHPYTPRGGPRKRPRRDEATISSLRRLTRTVDALARRGKLPRRLPIWITEFGFQTNPPDPFQYPIRRVPGFMDESEWRAFRNRRVVSYSQHQLRDDRLNRGGGFRRYAGFQGGLRFASGRPKLGVYNAWRMPVFVRAGGASRVSVFGGMRTAPGAVATIASRGRRGGYQQVGTARLNAAGYFQRTFRVRFAGARTYRITINGLSRVKRAARR